MQVQNSEVNLQLQNDIRYVKGPDGQPLSINDLPPAGTTRWVVRRKAEVVAAVTGGLISIEEACERYSITMEEFLSWQFLVTNHGLRALRVTRVANYRK